MSDAIRKLHSYDLPECIAIPIEEGSPEYLQVDRENRRKRNSS